MKKNIFVLLVTFVLFAVFAVPVIAENGDWVKVESKLVGASQLQNTNSIIIVGGKQITPPDISFSYWGVQGVYNVRFYGYQWISNEIYSCGISIYRRR